MRKVLFLVFAVVTLLVLDACKSIKKMNGGRGIILMSVDQDRQLGLQVANQIDNDPTHYPLLDSIKYKEVYQYLYKVRDNILNTGKVDLKDQFSWRLRVIHDDSTLNAFCTPGGYIYIYTGILKFLDSEDQLAGVLGHEIGHADMRHSIRQMQAMYGIQLLEQVILGNQSAILQVLNGLTGLKFSREHENEADERSVLYLCGTAYNADGAAGFFQKLDKMGNSSRPPEFLSTHPNPENRIEHFINSKTVMGCQGTSNFKEEYKKIVAKLPK